MSLHIRFQCPMCRRKIEGDLSRWHYSERISKVPIFLQIRSSGCGVHSSKIECPKCGEGIDLDD